ncbi:GGDEF domain-containing protein [Bosea sp. 685]|uniref:GGDEF domain-containing protein n=1 Tax=Bosea sp. 685 TaxID=3080057 RepID=UPI002892EC46|nr:GGDEF domain-containing protein [Bosea sp. 685]WNJ88668.1 GGDEF domain-containing protein [Bosea sp. 685]
MDLATVLLLHKSSFIVGAICFFYVRWRSKEPGLDFLAIGYGLLGVASTLAGAGEQGTLPYEVWTFGSFSIGVTGYSLMAMGLLRLSSRQRKPSGWLLLAIALSLSAIVGGMHWHADNQARAAIFNANTAAFLGFSCFVVLRDFFPERLPARLGLLASLAAAMVFSTLVVIKIIAPQYGPIEARYAFFMLIICHFSIALFVIVLVQERAEAQLKHLANTDALTGIPNRQHFLASIPNQLRTGDAFIMIDIDHFKGVNDRYGHEAGDVVLVGVAQAIAAVAGRGCMIGRLGGEEFALFLRDQTEATAFAMAEQIRRAVNALGFASGKETITPSVSAGVALWRGDCSAQKLRDWADQALYLAKRGGRDRVELHANLPSTEKRSFSVIPAADIQHPASGQHPRVEQRAA